MECAIKSSQYCKEFSKESFESQIIADPPLYPQISAADRRTLRRSEWEEVDFG